MPGHGRWNEIPDRWLDYKSVGKRLGTTRFVAFKVPLKQSLNQRVAPAQAFGPWELLDAMREDRQELGLIIDLTFTTRYYGPQDLPTSLVCMKIPTEGHVVPADDTVLAFKRAVRRFLRDNARNDKLIGVHCTHGLNRTGYMICRYLIDVDGMDPAEAIRLFNSCRGHDMERGNYIDDLRSGPRRSNAGMDERPPPSAQGRAVGRTRAQDGWRNGAGRACGFYPPGPKQKQPLEWSRNAGPQFFSKGARRQQALECPRYDYAFPTARSAANYDGAAGSRGTGRRGRAPRFPARRPPAAGAPRRHRAGDRGWGWN